MVTDPENTFAAVRACAVALLAGIVLQASGYSAGNGQIIDWNTVKSGETIQEEPNAFDTAHMFVMLVGTEAALRAADPFAEPPPPPAPEIVAFNVDEHGFRVRQFTVGAMRVRVEALFWIEGADDVKAEAFAARLSIFAAELVS